MIIFIVLILFSAVSVMAQFAQPFKWNAQIVGSDLIVSVDIPPDHYLYADKRTEIAVNADMMRISPYSGPKTVKHADEFGSGDIYPAGRQVWKYKIKPDQTYKVILEFQGCKEKTKDSPGICFIPSETAFTLQISPHQNAVSTDVVAESKPPVLIPEDGPVDALLDQFSVVNSGGGYLDKDEFIAFLSKSSGTGEVNPEFGLGNKGTIGIILLILLGGLALNLTPCVLPMIPVNLAVVGAGKATDKKSQGFIRGGVYGLGIAIAYGLLGIITVLSGAKFGTLNSVSWFNFLVAVIFIFLSLAMFEVFSIDLSRFSNAFGIQLTEKGVLIPVFLMGVLAALLAGACVAPVVIAVLLYSASLYAKGNITGLILPFVLGVGMAVPWPFAGAGIASLPKPGKWMLKVKQMLGIMILLFAAYYIYIGISLISGGNSHDPDKSFSELKKGLLQAKVENKPVLIDFWASWCKNCTQMKNSTFRDPEVIKQLGNFVVIQFQAEKPNQPDVKKLLDRYGIFGLPGFVILKGKSEREN